MNLFLMCFPIERSYILWPRSLVLKMACSASFFSRNSVFLSQQFSRNSVFQPVSAKVQTSERGQSCKYSIFYLSLFVRTLCCSRENDRRRVLGLGLLPAREGGRAEAVAGRGGWQRHTCTSPKRQRRWLASAGPTRPSPHRPAAALAVQGVGVRGAGEGVRRPRGEGAGVQSRGGDGAAAPHDEERRSSVSQP